MPIIFRIICLSVFGAFALHAADVDQPEPTQQQAVLIAKVAVEWLIFDDWVKPKPVDSSTRLADKSLARLRTSLQTAQYAKLQVDLMGADHVAESSLLYDRGAKSLTAIEKGSPGWNAAIIYLRIMPRGDSWRVEVDKGAIWSMIEIMSEDQVYYVRKVESVMIAD